MSEMLEKVGRALHAYEWNNQPNPEPYSTHRDYWEDAARAAIKAMMEPTGKMLAATMTETPALVGEETLDDLQMIRKDWQAMLTAALEDETDS